MSQLDAFLAMKDPMAVAALAALVIGSAIATERLLHRRHDRIAGRVVLIEPWTHAAARSTLRTVEMGNDPVRGDKFDPAEREIARRLRKRGLATGLAPVVLAVCRLVSVVALSVGCWFLLPHLIGAGPTLRIAFTAGAGALAWFLPAVAAGWSAQRRAAAIVAGLPDALELLVITAEGGLSLGDGIDRIVAELRRSQPDLAEELALTAADLKILPSQDQALSRLAARIDVPLIQSVVTTLMQTMRYGTPFAKAIRVMAAEIRSDALVHLEERANRLPTLMTIPMIVFILPTIFLIVGGPAALKIVDVFVK